MDQMTIRRILEEGKDNERFDVLAMVIGNVSSGYTPSIKLWGVVADSSAPIRFTVWPNFGDIDIQRNTWYKMHNVKYYHNNFTPNFILDTRSTITKLHSDEVIEELASIEFDDDLPYRIVRVRGICLRIDPHNFPNVKQKGWIGNIEQFQMPFTMFNSGGQTPLEEGKIYDIEYASVEYFHFRRELYVDCAEISEISPQEYPVNISDPFFGIDIAIGNSQSKQIFPHIFSTAESIYGLTSDEIQSRIQAPLIEAHANYQQMMIANYSNSDSQLAYMFGYFPYYIEPIREVLNSIGCQELNRFIKNGLKINFYGCGPAPELLGFVRYISEKYPAINQIEARFIDGNSWSPWRRCVIDNISHEYWQGNISFSEHEVNLINLSTLPQGLISDADIHCIQNVCSDLILREDNDEVINWLKSIYLASKANSLMIVMDIGYSYIRTLLFEPTIERIKRIHDDATIITTPSFHRANLDFIPSIISLPTNRQSNGYRYMVIIKNRWS